MEPKQAVLESTIDYVKMGIFTYPTMSLKGCYQGLPSFPQFIHQS
jgi:hypothetical protein